MNELTVSVLLFVGFVALLYYLIDVFMNRAEVFHLYKNKYDWNEAQKACAKYGARLATEQELKQAYNDGAHWCNYGWSAGGKALFPSQTESPECGKKGINGGVFYKEVELGVNCFGKKPKYQADYLEQIHLQNKSLPKPMPQEREIISWNDLNWSKFGNI